MNSHDFEEPAWSDAELDALLTAFFRNEMPDELRALPEPASPAVSRQSRRKAGAYCLVAAALGLFWAGAAIWSPRTAPSDVVRAGAGSESPGQEPRREHVASPAGGIGSQPLSPRVQLPEESPPVLHQFVGDGLESGERQKDEAGDGPVEQRTSVPRTPRLGRDPASGTPVEILLPEVTIEVYPLESPPDRRKPERDRP